jgi:chaperonin GroEL
VITLSAHNDVAVGERVSDALEKVDVAGVVSVKESKTSETETVVKVVEGMRLDLRALSQVGLANPEILVTLS